jgi:hypothetical protein
MMNKIFLNATLSLAISLLVIIVRLWNKHEHRTSKIFDRIDISVSLVSFASSALFIFYFQESSIKFSLNSSSNELVIASVSILFTVLTYVTLNTANEVRSVGKENQKLIAATEAQFIKFRAHLGLIASLRDAENLAELENDKEIKVRQLQSLYKLFSSEEECTRTLSLLSLPDQIGTLNLVSNELREYILSLPNVYPGNIELSKAIDKLRRKL